MRRSPAPGGRPRAGAKEAVIAQPSKAKEARAREAKAKDGRERRCAATGEVLPESRLVRFALGPGGVVTPDVAARLPGRGVWVSASRAAIATALKRNAFAKAFKAPVRAGADLADQTERLLARRCLDLLGLAKRAGAVAIGATAGETAIRAAPPLALIEAADSAEDGRERLIRLAFGLHGQEPALCGCFTATELGMALGRERVVHACLLQERMALAWAVEMGRLAGFRSIVPSSWPESRRESRVGPSDAAPASSDLAMDEQTPSDD